MVSMADKQEPEKKIIVDEDWKVQAQQEKEKLAAEQEKEETAGEAGALPEADFAGLVNLLATQALFALGLLTQQGQQREPDFALAKFNIDMLDVLAVKTGGNLTEDEERLLKSALGQIRMAFVQMSQQG